MDISQIERIEFPRVPHYYGDAVRGLFIGAAVLIIFLAPLYTASLAAQGPFIVVGVLALVGLAAMTNPRTKTVAIADSIVSAIGTIMFGVWSLSGYEAHDPVAFVIRGAIAVMLLFAFYFSMKTVRAMLQRKIGKPDRYGDFR